jgi:DNA-directed RNA polymerase subunit RPC12/RpoP
MKVDPQRHCPHCGSAEVFRSHRRGAIERYLFRAIGMRSFRCVNCDARFYRHKHSDDPASRDIKAA